MSLAVKSILVALLLSIGFTMPKMVGQNVHQTFKDTRVINSQSIETLRKGILDFRIGHRFGNFSGGWSSFYGLETATDVLFEFDYGLTDNMMVGLMRTKGSGPLKQNISGLLKLRVLRQGDSSPFSIAFSGLSSISTMAKTEDPGRINFFPKFVHRMSYHLQVIVASRVSERLALQISPQWTYRNYIANDDTSPIQDNNAIASISGSAKFQFTKSFALIYDMTISFSEYRGALDAQGNKSFFLPIGIGFEWETGGGHVFQMNLTNASGIVETDYIPYTSSNWGDGEYRLGFTIGRHFKL